VQAHVQVALVPAVEPLSGAQHLGDHAAHRLWELGRAVPHRITTALDLHRLEGPEVDWACGVEEPTVDLWEAGALYPSWAQLCRLAELTGRPIGFFFLPGPAMRWSDTTLRFHPGGRRRSRGVYVEPEPEPDRPEAFALEAIAAAIRDELADGTLA
jgi:transcriptional regulator with XRE-family HTH domain